ncbi:MULTISPECIES: hypothetical protein [unclassified Halorhabdus]|uniref:DUF7312 domain-containing protein n=1 Tax=unclassified Halorhabdus TaxID=2621901 RepID=UPI0023DBE484|nr:MULTISPECIES: hypothetical protein [unclassified Halorhabdus]WEL17833.1 Uncharacterized protein SVXHr_1666 [Halorhabdus sp. SVX81]WEL21709.1 Uncharacterized protein HBNXHr_1648 [Halorhabdus sp. BNX81]
MDDDEWNDDPVEFDEAGDGRNGEPGDGADDTASDDEWRFTLEDLADDDGEDDTDGFSLYAEIEAGSPSAENALFVGLGLAFGLVVVWQLLF